MSKDEEVVQEALNWLRFAEEDLNMARQIMIMDAPAPRYVCWLRQQAAEKALKAALVYEGIGALRTHDLNGLQSRPPQ